MDKQWKQWLTLFFWALKSLHMAIGGRRRRGWQRMRWWDGITDTMDMGLSGLRELVIGREAWCAVVHGVAKSWTQQSDWTELSEWMSESRSVVSDSLQPHGLYRILYNSGLGQNTGVGSLSLLQGIIPTQGSILGLLHCRWMLYQLNHKGSPSSI